jgi:hypothetical protein
MVRSFNWGHSPTFILYEAVDYRLLQHAPFLAALQDAAAVYAHLVDYHLRA